MLHSILESWDLRHYLIIFLSDVFLQVSKIDIPVLHHRIVRVLRYTDAFAYEHLRRRSDFLIVLVIVALRGYRELQGRAQAHRIFDHFRLDDLLAAQQILTFVISDV